MFRWRDSERETPLPIPNRVVKPLSGDGTWRATSWESRSPPVLLEPPPRGRLFRGRTVTKAVSACLIPDRSRGPWTASRRDINQGNGGREGDRRDHQRH